MPNIVIISAVFTCHKIAGEHVSHGDVVKGVNICSPVSICTPCFCGGLQALNILFLGDKSGKGTFFPEGIPGKINTGKGFDELASGTESFPIWPKKAPQVCMALCA